MEGRGTIDQQRSVLLSGEPWPRRLEQGRGAGHRRRRETGAAFHYEATVHTERLRGRNSASDRENVRLDIAIRVRAHARKSAEAIGVDPVGRKAEIDHYVQW